MRKNYRLSWLETRMPPGKNSLLNKKLGNNTTMNFYKS